MIYDELSSCDRRLVMLLLTLRPAWAADVIIATAVQRELALLKHIKFDQVIWRIQEQILDSYAATPQVWELSAPAGWMRPFSSSLSSSQAWIVGPAFELHVVAQGWTQIGACHQLSFFGLSIFRFSFILIIEVIREQEKAIDSLPCWP